MLDLAIASAETFNQSIGATFEVVFTDGRLPLTLADVRSLDQSSPTAPRAGFSLTFQGPPNLRLPQQVYRLENAQLGALEIFLVQVSANSTHSEFEAVFN